MTGGGDGQVRIVVPDDAPSVLDGTAAHQRLKELGSVELYTSEGDSNLTTWQKVYDFTDDGAWAGQLGKCGGSDPKAPLVWGGPIATFRWDNASDVDIKWLSVREIEPGSGGLQSPASGPAHQ